MNVFTSKMYTTKCLYYILVQFVLYVQYCNVAVTLVLHVYPVLHKTAHQDVVKILLLMMQDVLQY